MGDHLKREGISTTIPTVVVTLSDSRGKGMGEFLQTQRLLPYDTVIEDVCKPGADLEAVLGGCTVGMETESS